jgi:hypothetical protein
MPRRKRVLMWAGLLVVLAGAGMAGMVLLWPCSSINRNTFEKVKPGMSLAEVKALFHVPAGDYTSRPVELPTFHSHEAAPGTDLKFWAGDDGLIIVEFDPHERVTTAEFYEVRLVPQSLLDRLRHWLGL